MFRKGIVLLITWALVFSPIYGQSLYAQAENDLLAFPEPLTVETLATGVVSEQLSADDSIILERVVLPAGGMTATRHVGIAEVIYVEQGELVLADSIGLRSTLSEEGAVYLRAGASYGGENAGTDETVYLRLWVDAPVTTETILASPQAVPLVEGDELVTELARMPLAQDGHQGSTLYIARASLQPGDSSGEFALAESMVVMVEDGSLKVASPSGLDGQLDVGNVVMLPVQQALTIRNDGEAAVTALLIGIAPIHRPTISAPLPTPTPLPPTPTPEAAGAEYIESAADSDLDLSDGAILYEADISGGFENWATAGGWHLVSGMLVNDGTSKSVVVAAAPIDIPISDYAVEVELQWNRDGGSFGLVGRDGDTGGYFAGYVTKYESDRRDILLWGASNRPIAEYRLPLDNNWHIYRLEVKGNLVRVFVDGAIVIETADNSFLGSGQAGIWSNGAQVNVRSFRIVSLASGSVDFPGGYEMQAIVGRGEGRHYATGRLGGFR